MFALSWSSLAHGANCTKSSLGAVPPVAAGDHWLQFCLILLTFPLCAFRNNTDHPGRLGLEVQDQHPRPV